MISVFRSTSRHSYGLASLGRALHAFFFKPNEACIYVFRYRSTDPPVLVISILLDSFGDIVLAKVKGHPAWPARVSLELAIFLLVSTSFPRSPQLTVYGLLLDRRPLCVTFELER
jgi:hypothetical protein